MEGRCSRAHNKKNKLFSWKESNILILMLRPATLDPDLLRAFVLIAEERSFTRAAQLVGRTQSAVSMQVQRLEGVLGQQLFHRGRGG